jgi:hypothetical protein
LVAVVSHAVAVESDGVSPALVISFRPILSVLV